MIPAPFEYQRVEFVDHAIQVLSDDPEAKILAGGHSLLPLMRVRLARPSKLVDITRIEDLKYVREEDDHVAIGGRVVRGVLQQMRKRDRRQSRIDFDFRVVIRIHA